MPGYPGRTRRAGKPHQMQKDDRPGCRHTLLNAGRRFILAPILIFFILRLVSLDLSRGLTMGAIIFAVMPCGGMVPAYTSMLNGKVNLAVCTVAFSLLLSIGVVPISIELLAGESIRTPCLLIARFHAMCVVTPIVAAWLLRRYVVARKGAHIYERVKRSLKTLSGLGLASMVFVAQLFCSILFAKAARSSYPDFVAFVISTTANNTALAMALATSYFGSEASLFIAVAGNLVQLPGMLGFLRIFSSTRAAIVQRQLSSNRFPPPGSQAAKGSSPGRIESLRCQQYESGREIYSRIRPLNFQATRNPEGCPPV